MQATIPVGVQRLWLGWLTSEWDAVNARHLGGRLRRPQILLDRSTGRDGSWNPVSRCLTISLDHVLRSLWVEVALTLRHEMAHQVVDEMFLANQASQHGVLFHRAARLLDLDGSPKLAREASPADQRVLDRIRKLMNLAQSPNPHEAQAAMAAANRLLLRHNLASTEPLDTPLYLYRWLGKPMGRIPLERKLLSAILQDFFFVRTIWIATSEMSTGRQVWVLEVMGKPHNVSIAEYVHDYLGSAPTRMWAEYRQDHRPLRRPRAMRNSFCIGVLQGFRQHLETERETCREQGLIWMGDTGLTEFLKRRHPDRSRCGYGSYLAGSVHEDGVRAGRAIRIRPGLNEPPAMSRGLSLDFERDDG